MKKLEVPQITISTEKLLSVIGIVMSFFALLVSWRANHISEEANAIARKQNEIALLAVSADVNAVKGYKTDIVTFYECKYAHLNQDYIYLITQNTITFVNNGGLATSLIGVNLLAGSFNWSVAIYERDTKLSLPIDIQPGTARVLTFVAKTTHPKGEGGIWEVDEEGKHILNWNFEFGNGAVVIWTTRLFPDVGAGSHTDCEYYDAVERLYGD